jgi:large conductance mechanosensitive channel
MKNLLDEFKTFALKGNVIDLAVGVIIGAAFGKIVSSVVEDLIMPVVGAIWKADFSNMYVGLSSEVYKAVETAEKAGAPLSLGDAKKFGPVFAYGSFITVLINFAIIAFCVFMLVKFINRLAKKKAEEPAPAAPPEDVKLLTEIRDLLKAQQGGGAK